MILHTQFVIFYFFDFSKIGKAKLGISRGKGQSNRNSNWHWWGNAYDILQRSGN